MSRIEYKREKNTGLSTTGCESRHVRDHAGMVGAQVFLGAILGIRDVWSAFNQERSRLLQCYILQTKDEQGINVSPANSP